VPYYVKSKALKYVMTDRLALLSADGFNVKLSTVGAEPSRLLHMQVPATIFPHNVVPAESLSSP